MQNIVALVLYFLLIRYTLICSISINNWKNSFRLAKLLGLTVLDFWFMRRYLTLYGWPSLPSFRFTDTTHLLDCQEQNINQTHEANTVEWLSRFLMMLKTGTFPFHSLQPLKWDLGMAADIDRTLVPNYLDHFQVIKTEESVASELQMINGSIETKDGYRQFKSGGTSVAFLTSFPKGYGDQKKVKAWVDDFQKLPYVSPNEDSAHIGPNGDLMEKIVVGVLHELFTRIFTWYPGIFYLSLKCKTTTITLKEGYSRGKLVDEHPLASIRKKYYYVTRTGILYRGQAIKMVNLTW
ncbi:hypothetical protein MKW92_000771 [Papaver armeniacum]|nr:hypothetical protein MKW92_000771 [Papaver armeniacum]